MRWARTGTAAAAALVLSAGCTAGSTAPRSVSATTPAVAPTTDAPTAEPSVTALSLPTPAAAAASPSPGTALALLATIPVKGRAPMTGYSRDRFGPAWSDTDRNGCDTRNDVLRRDLVAQVIKAGTHGCVVLSGDRAPDPYTGVHIHFVRGGPSELDIDHVVALGNAWVTGAFAWPAAKRLALANDPLELLAVDSSANRQKGDGDAATWLPSYKASRCAYVARQVAVKEKYRLWVTRAEHDAIARVLASCPGRPAPTGGTPTLAPGWTDAPPPTRAATTTTTASGTDPRFGTCKEAKAHGYGPYVQGRDPEYAWYTDRDHDGVVCE